MRTGSTFRPAGARVGVAEIRTISQRCTTEAVAAERLDLATLRSRAIVRAWTKRGVTERG